MIVKTYDIDIKQTWNNRKLLIRLIRIRPPKGHLPGLQPSNAVSGPYGVPSECGG